MNYWIRFWTHAPFVDAHEWYGDEMANGRPRLGDNVGDCCLIETKFRIFKNLGSMIEPDGDEFSIDLDLPDDAAAVAFADAFNKMRLDPWRVDWISREGNPEVYIY